MKRERRAEVIRQARWRVAIIVEEIFSTADPFFDDREEQTLCEQETARIANRIDARCGER